MPGNDKDTTNYIEASLSVPQNIHDAVCNFIIENYSGGLILEAEEKSGRFSLKKSPTAFSGPIFS